MSYQLFKISQEKLNLLNEIEELDGELTPELESQLTLTNENLKVQVIENLNIIEMLQSNIDAANKKQLQIIEFIKRKEKNVNLIKHNLLQALLMFGQEDKKGIKRLTYGEYELSTRKNKSIEIINADLIPDKYKKVDVTFKDLSVLQLQTLKDALDHFDYNQVLDKLEENIKVSKTELKPAIEAIQPNYEKELIHTKDNFKKGHIDEAAYNKIINQIELEFSLLQAAIQETKISLTIK